MSWVYTLILIGVSLSYDMKEFVRLSTVRTSCFVSPSGTDTVTDAPVTGRAGVDNGRRGKCG